jgi:hypothetical protein
MPLKVSGKEALFDHRDLDEVRLYNARAKFGRHVSFDLYRILA